MTVSLLPKSREHYERLGYYIEKVEHWNSFGRVRQDLFGFADLIGLHPEERPILVQVTSKSNMRAREKKILASPLYTLASKCFTIVVQGWAKEGNRWTHKEIAVCPE
jgi:hypothetical protein